MMIMRIIVRVGGYRCRVLMIFTGIPRKNAMCSAYCIYTVYIAVDTGQKQSSFMLPYKIIMLLAYRQVPNNRTDYAYNADHPSTRSVLVYTLDRSKLRHAIRDIIGNRT